MPGPIQGLRFIHHAILTEVRALDEAIARLTVDDDGAALRARFELFHTIGHGHTHAEEVGLMPALDEKLPGLFAPYELDHRDEDRHVERIESALEEWARDPGTRASLLDVLRRHAACLSDHLERHIRKENELLLPLVDERFTPEEQGQMMGRMMGSLSPEERVLGMPWTVERLTPEMRKTWAGIFKQMMPPEQLAPIRDVLRAKLPPPAWDDVASILG